MIPVAATFPTIATLPTGPTTSSQMASGASHDGSFFHTIHDALSSVGQSQAAATKAETAVAAGKPGASQATALVLSDRAELGWTGIVAVRNEVVSAYQTLSNMQI